MIKNIVLDFGNVIGTFRVRKIIEGMTPNKEEQQFLIDEVLNSPEWLRYSYLDSGYLTYE